MLTDATSGQLAADIIAAIKSEILESGRFSLPNFGLPVTAPGTLRA